MNDLWQQIALELDREIMNELLNDGVESNMAKTTRVSDKIYFTAMDSEDEIELLRRGVGEMSMRRLARELSVETMDIEHLIKTGVQLGVPEEDMQKAVKEHLRSFIMKSMNKTLPTGIQGIDELLMTSKTTRVACTGSDSCLLCEAGVARKKASVDKAADELLAMEKTESPPEKPPGMFEPGAKTWREDQHFMDWLDKAFRKHDPMLRQFLHAIRTNKHERWLTERYARWSAINSKELDNFIKNKNPCGEIPGGKAMQYEASERVKLGGCDGDDPTIKPKRPYNEPWKPPVGNYDLIKAPIPTGISVEEKEGGWITVKNRGGLKKEYEIVLSFGPNPNCPECKGSGFYTGLEVREPCKTCGSATIQ